METIYCNSRNAEIYKTCEALTCFLQVKNERYGDSALDPIHVFAKIGSETQLQVRIDDKLSRIKNSSALRKNDVVDLMGYLVLLCIQKEWTDFGDLLD